MSTFNIVPELAEASEMETYPPDILLSLDAKKDDQNRIILDSGLNRNTRGSIILAQGNNISWDEMRHSTPIAIRKRRFYDKDANVTILYTSKY